MKLKHFWLITSLCVFAVAGLTVTCDKKPTVDVGYVDSGDFDSGAAGACYEPASSAGGMCE